MVLATIIRREPKGVALLLGAGVVAVVNFAWQLGSSSYFVDEALSVQHATPSVSRVVHVVLTTESTPPTYFLFLHEWLGRVGSQQEWVARFPSVVACVLLVVVMFWLASRVTGRAAAGVAGLLVALSPLVVEYAQQVRVYAFVMLAATIAVAAAVESERRSTRAGHWLALSAVAATLAPWLHYTALFVIGPLAIWIAVASAHAVRRRLWWLGAVGVALVALAPVLVEQQGNPNGLKHIAVLNGASALSLIGTPFSVRTFPPAITVWSIAGAIVTLGCAAWAVSEWSRRRSPALGLVTACATVPVAAVLLATLAGQDIAINRYTAVAAPFLIVVIAAAIIALPRPVGAIVAALAAAASIAGLVETHQRSGYHLDARGVMAHIAAQLRPGDVIFTPSDPGATIPLTYYGKRDIPTGPPFVPDNDTTTVARVIRERHRIWVIKENPRGGLAAVRPGLRRLGYHAIQYRRFASVTPMGVFLITPDS